MPALENSQRRIYKGTYVPIRADAKDIAAGSKKLLRRPLDKLNLLRGLRPTTDEAIRLAEATGDDAGKASPPNLVRLLGELALDESAIQGLRLLSLCAEIDKETFVEFATRLIESRRRVAHDLKAGIESIQTQYSDHLNQTGGKRSSSRTKTSTEMGAARPPKDSDSEALGWALNHSESVLGKAIRSARQLVRVNHLGGSSPAELVHSIIESLNANIKRSEQLTQGFVDRFEIEPIGRLYLERMEMTPVGVERGELVSSIPLTPGESVNLGHKEWAVKTEEFETIILDEEEEFSEKGVTEKTDLSQSSDSQKRHSTAFSMSGTYTGYGATVSVGYNSTSDNQQSEKDSRQQSINTTRKASARTRQEHKNSFKATSVIGSEDQSVRTIKNPSDSKSMRVDYYQLMRRWRVDLFRYDLRMTYDLVIPSPGVALLRNIDELRTLDALIETPFTFAITPTDIQRETWQDFVMTWGGNVDFPPAAMDELTFHHEVNYSCDSDGTMEALDFSINEDYRINEGDFVFHYATCGNLDDYMFGLINIVGAHNDQKDTFRSPLARLVGKSGDLAISYTARNIHYGAMIVTLGLVLTEEAFARWQYRTWDVLRTAAQDGYYARRQQYIDRRISLQEEMKGWDALTLRKMEREEIMKGVLTWLLGPEFEIVPSDIESFFEPAFSEGASPLVSLPVDENNWARVLHYGEMIKFMHQAIEWENVLFFTYPYFWDSPLNWEFKQFIRHGDSIHRDFLRAGSARVVLTIRPGFEIAFAELMESGTLDGEHPYVAIANEIRNHALTNYAGIPAANPESLQDANEVIDRERGNLIGQWYEYTPTSALDVSLDASLGELA